MEGAAAETSSAAEGGPSTSSNMGGGTPRVEPSGRLGSSLAAATAFRHNVRRIFERFDADADGRLSRSELAALINAVRAATPRPSIGGSAGDEESGLPVRASLMRALTASEHATLFRELKLLPDAGEFILFTVPFCANPLTI